MNKLEKQFNFVLGITSFLLAVPRMAFAQNDLSQLLTTIQNLINSLLPILASFALLGFFYGLVKYVFQADNEQAREDAKQVIIAGIVSLFLMASIGGIVNYLVNQFGFNDPSITPPTIDVTPPSP